MKDEDFGVLAKLVRDGSGLALNRDKDYLLETRLLPVARKHNLASVVDLTRVLRERGRAEIERDVIEAMTTNESFFFRDAGAFKYFRETVLPPLVASRSQTKKLRIWCAACSSGQEPYSLAIIMAEEKLRAQGWQIDIVCTDIAKSMIDRSRAGTYSHYEVQRGLPIIYLAKYFDKQGTDWTVKADVRQGISFQLLNLLQPFSSLGTFDVIFCRNVLIYFDAPTKSLVLDRMHRQLTPDGTLYLGGAETVLGISDKFAPKLGAAGVFGPATQSAALARVAAR